MRVIVVVVGAAALAGVASLGVACATVADIEAVDTNPAMQHCIDGIRDDGETDIDCGGPDCLACGGAACTANAQCQSGTCTAQACAVATCSDGVWDGYESSLDCGDPRGELIMCPLCPIGVHCFNGCNCLSGSCDLATDTCASGPANCNYCDDGVQDNNETGVDCGGPCPPCADAGAGGG